MNENHAVCVVFIAAAIACFPVSKCSHENKKAEHEYKLELEKIRVAEDRWNLERNEVLEDEY